MRHRKHHQIIRFQITIQYTVLVKKRERTRGVVRHFHFQHERHFGFVDQIEHGAALQQLCANTQFAGDMRRTDEIDNVTGLH